MPSKVILIIIEFMFLGINIFWAILRAHFNPRLAARDKMSLSRAQNIFMPTNIKAIVILLFISNVAYMFDQTEQFQNSEPSRANRCK